MIKNSFLSLLLLLFAPTLSSAQVFTNDEYGYSIEVDDSFQLTRNDHATYFRSEDNGRMIVIKNWPGLDEATAKDYLQHGYQSHRIAIVPVGELKEISLGDGKGFLIDTQGVIERSLIKGIAGGFIGNKGQGIVVVISGASEDWDKLAPIAQNTAASIKFIDFKAGPGAHDWYYMLSGTRLSLRGTSNNRSNSEDIYFCGDGSFRHRMSSSAIKDSDSGSALGFSGRTRSGSWEVVDDDGNSRLILLYNDGREKTAIIEDRSGQTFLGGQRYFMMRNHRCR